MLITAEVAPASTVRVVSPLVICPGLLLDLNSALNLPSYWSSFNRYLCILGSRTVSDVTENDRSTCALVTSIWIIFNLTKIELTLHVEFEVSTIYPLACSHSVQIW